MKMKYFLKAEWQTEWTEVTKHEWIKAERAAGFRPKGDYTIDDCATGGFSSGSVSGKIEYIKQNLKTND